jgi:hypothetical protein
MTLSRKRKLYKLLSEWGAKEKASLACSVEAGSMAVKFWFQLNVDTNVGQCFNILKD